MTAAAWTAALAGAGVVLSVLGAAMRTSATFAALSGRVAALERSAGALAKTASVLVSALLQVVWHVRDKGADPAERAARASRLDDLHRELSRLLGPVVALEERDSNPLAGDELVRLKRLDVKLRHGQPLTPAEVEDLYTLASRVCADKPYSREAALLCAVAGALLAAVLLAAATE